MNVFTIMSQRLFAIGWSSLSSPWPRREEGQTFVEYALILGVIAVGVVGALTVLSSRITALYAKIIADYPFT